LQARFECPVVDVYSMNEAGPIAVRDPAAGGHVLLQPGMFVEILDPAGRPVPPGERGEVTLTGGFNAWLPLLRYRTGDYAALRFDGSVPVLGDLEGRPPVRYRTAQGGWINNIEITHALRVFAIPQYTVCQRGDGSIEVRLSAASGARERVREVLVALLGAGQRLSVEEVAAFDGKVVQYTSELVDACP
jgi:phenylacetate-CoA ligase